ncbi:hypothetical protein [Streptomyces sp. NPDC047046]|uniref:hypothetical protein n=1 Tax=Streptomyces sp. NPDC047046 TaxID=3155378 RepID=UPI0033C10EDB
MTQEVPEAVPSTTLYRWQRQAQRVLDELLAEGEKLGLPPLAWTLAENGALVGEAAQDDHDERREAVRRWAAHVGAVVDNYHAGNGYEELHVDCEIVAKGAVGPVPSGFRAVIPPTRTERA